MATIEQFNVALIGAAGRGGSFKAGFTAAGARIHAVCDINEDELATCAEKFGADETYTDYETMLERSELDAVVIGTPMPLHVTQSIMALDRNVHVLSEVPAGVSVEECRDLVAACARSKAIYMMGENYTYMKSNVLVKELVRQGLFGDVYYAEGEYIHELKAHNEVTVWRRKWQTGIRGVTYPTHSLGPILQWMPGDRVARLCCACSGGDLYKDPRGKPYADASTVMLCETEKKSLIKIRVDMVSDRPHSMTNYQLQGTDGAYESGRGGPGEVAKLWLRELNEKQEWSNVPELLEDDEFREKYLPAIWRDATETAKAAGHGGGDYFEILDFIRAARGDAPCPIGIHEAMDMTLPGLISQQSVLQEGAWLEVPDSRAWQ